VFEGLRARLERLLADHTPSADPRARAAALQDALVETKAAVSELRSLLAVTERQLALERQQLADAERRGPLARDIGDADTARIADEFAARHRDRVAVLERKLAVQREELGLAERDVEQLLVEFRRVRQGGGGGPTDGQSAAWRDIEAAGGVRPETDTEGELLKQRIDRDRMDAAVQAQLEQLKKKLGRDG
jgi:hypothetical protein